ncbi:MAG TPA: glycosyltransferase family 2 protein [Desulfobacteraceae bacterium]|nr:glycosyltransferase family 2 protein [Desulfobacteraceae bacterium]
MTDLTGTVMSAVAALVFLANLYAVLTLVAGAAKMRRLADIKPLRTGKRPKVSIIVPACNEADTIEPALLSLLALDYDPLEVIVVNDRSTDRTTEVLEAVRAKHPRLIVRHIAELPEGWLGKTHALSRGAGLAGGEFLLFTDADIHFEPSTLARAMTLMADEQLDHLSLIFRHIGGGPLLNAMMIDAGAGLLLLFRPWKAGDPASGNFFGVGAFNLVRKSAYTAVNGHEPVKMHTIDDIMLGKVIKRNGFRQECLLGLDCLRVHWYESPGTMIRGLMKNIFALFNYRLVYVLAGLLLVLTVAVLPLWGVLLTSGPPRIFFGLAVTVRLFSAAAGARFAGVSLRTVPLTLLTPYVNIYMILRATTQTLAARGIEWRGTRYPLEQLRKSMPILWP